MRPNLPRTAITAALPLLLLATAATSQAADTEPRPDAPKAAFVLDAAAGTFTPTGRRAPAAHHGIRSLATYDGKATTSQLLAKPGAGQVIADTTMANSPNPKERAAWAASSKFVDLSWPDLGAKSYTVTRNGKVLATTKTNSFRDTGIRPGSEAGYQITGEAGGLGHTWGLDATVPVNDSTKTLKATAEGLEAKARKYTKTVINWRSFIRQKWVTVPSYISKPAGCKYGSNYKYRGDGRGFSRKVSGPHFRAGVRAVINWNKSKYSYKRGTGWTKVYTKKGKYVAKRKASYKKITFKAMTRHNGKDRAVRGVVEATDPFCPKSGMRKAGIGVVFNARLARNGDFYVSGTYKPAPDHEMYLYGVKGKKHTTRTVHQSRMSTHKFSGLECLFAKACERGTIGNSGGY
ncbi:hypothetical protein [Streptomyces sp. NPDC101393]|uniref:hypothetical protein n=1 Tax=Streptomyces sp. NPDC101393 TaxID=3366141 RepID=UPI0038115250